MKPSEQLEKALTVKGLIKQLQRCDPDLPVVCEYAANDHHRTFKIPKDPNGNADYGEELIEVVVLR